MFLPGRVPDLFGGPVRGRLLRLDRSRTAGREVLGGRLRELRATCAAATERAPRAAAPGAARRLRLPGRPGHLGGRAAPPAGDHRPGQPQVSRRRRFRLQRAAGRRAFVVLDFRRRQPAAAPAAGRWSWASRRSSTSSACARAACANSKSSCPTPSISSPAPCAPATTSTAASKPSPPRPPTR